VILTRPDTTRTRNDNISQFNSNVNCNYIADGICIPELQFCSLGGDASGYNTNANNTNNNIYFAAQYGHPLQNFSGESKPIDNNSGSDDKNISLAPQNLGENNAILNINKNERYHYRTVESEIDSNNGFSSNYNSKELGYESRAPLDWNWKKYGSDHGKISEHIDDSSFSQNSVVSLETPVMKTLGSVQSKIDLIVENDVQGLVSRSGREFSTAKKNSEISDCSWGGLDAELQS
jgi:hypothetical protein